MKCNEVCLNVWLSEIAILKALSNFSIVNGLCSELTEYYSGLTARRGQKVRRGQNFEFNFLTLLSLYIYSAYIIIFLI